MALDAYRGKRNFRKTSEPAGVKRAPAKAKRPRLIFVVHKHASSRLHYDVRLELGGILKSWAVPKGPSMDPKDRRLAMHVEDHPYAYKEFEGTIPEGQYGAGRVIVWDRGTYSSLPPEESEEALIRAYRKGHLSFILKGKKLKGEFGLVRVRSSKYGRNGEGAWLLIKAKDEYATKKDVLKDDTSVLSRRRLPDPPKRTTV